MIINANSTMQAPNGNVAGTFANFRGATSIDLSDNRISSRRLSDENTRTRQANSAFGVAGSDLDAEMLRRIQGDVTIDETNLQFSLHGSFASFIETGNIVGSDVMEDYSRYDDPMMRTQLAHIAREAFFRSNTNGVRSIEEMTRLFDERLDALRNASNITEERRELEIETLKRGFVLAVEMRLNGTQGYNRHIAGNGDSRFSTLEAIGQFSLSAMEQILRSGASEEARNLFFEGLEKVIRNTSLVVMGQEIVDLMSSTSTQNEIDALQEKFEWKQARFDEFISAMREDVQSIGRNSNSEMSRELLTRTLALFRQWGWETNS